MYKDQGLKAFWRGNGANLWLHGWQVLAQVAFFDTIKSSFNEFAFEMNDPVVIVILSSPNSSSKGSQLPWSHLPCHWPSPIRSTQRECVCRWIISETQEKCSLAESHPAGVWSASKKVKTSIDRINKRIVSRLRYGKHNSYAPSQYLCNNARSLSEVQGSRQLDNRLASIKRSNWILNIFDATASTWHSQVFMS